MVNTVTQWCAIALPQAVGPCGSELFPGALTNELSLELREAGQQMQVQPPLWRGGVRSGWLMLTSLMPGMVNRGSKAQRS